MRVKTASTIFLAAVTFGGVSSQRVLQDVVPVVGIDFSSSSIDSGSGADSTTAVADDEELIKAVEYDDKITVVSPIEMGELLCDTLVQAEDAAALSFVLLDNEMINAEKTFYAASNGDAFMDDIGRKVWMGTVTGPAQGEDEAIPRTVSMAWGDVCNTEVTKQSTDGVTTIVKTFPCYGSTTHTCMVEVEVDIKEPGDGIPPPNDAIIGTSTDSGEDNTTDASPTLVSIPSDRRLQDGGDTVIDVMVVFSLEALFVAHEISSQMVTILWEAIGRTNEAFVNSDVALYLNAVYIGLTTTDASQALRVLRSDEYVLNLREETGADLVQKIGSFNPLKPCGAGYFYGSGSETGFSTVDVTCLDLRSHSHEFGHNLGCDHNREDATNPTEYAHGLRYCSGNDQYRTIMGYACGDDAPRVNYFSNPDVSYLNKPTGTATEDCARAIEGNMVCAAFCEGFPYFGTEYSSECFCGVDIDDPMELGAARCTYACAGDASQTCGGPSAVSVYKNNDWVASSLEYLGCWTDTSGGRIMDVVKSDPSMTNDLCEEICSSYPFYGTQYGQECWCGSESTDYTTHGVSDSCNVRCAGDASQTCGGSYTVSVFEHEPAVPSGYLGCWEDSDTGRIMDVGWYNPAMTNELCEEICVGYAFYGTQYAQECWCGDASTDYTVYGESTSCNMPCVGNSGTVCGGRYAMSVWEN